MPGIKEEFAAFLISVIAGIVVRLCYQGISCLREIYRHKLWMINVEDVFFWTGTSMYLFVQIYHTSNGSIRWYFVLGVVVGVLIATKIVRKIKKVCKKIYDFPLVKNIAEKMKKRYYNKY